MFPQNIVNPRLFCINKRIWLQHGAPIPVTVSDGQFNHVICTYKSVQNLFEFIIALCNYGIQFPMEFRQMASIAYTFGRSTVDIVSPEPLLRIHQCFSCTSRQRICQFIDEWDLGGLWRLVRFPRLLIKFNLNVKSIFGPAGFIN